MRVAWATDVHLNFVDEAGSRDFADSIADSNADALLLGGDITEAPSLAGTLESLASAIDRPIYFVLGNHDYYEGDIESTRTDIRQLCDHDPRLHWLPTAGVVPL